MTGDAPTDDAPDAPDVDACPGCGAPVPGRPVGDGAPTRRRGSCRRCGLQLVGVEGERWRQIRG